MWSLVLYNHAKSLLKVVASNISNILFIWIKESLHPRMGFQGVDDGTGNSINLMKNLHESMFKHVNTHKNKDHE